MYIGMIKASICDDPFHSHKKHTRTLSNQLSNKYIQIYILCRDIARYAIHNTQKTRLANYIQIKYVHSDAIPQHTPQHFSDFLHLTSPHPNLQLNSQFYWMDNVYKTAHTHVLVSKNDTHTYSTIPPNAAN